MRKSWTYYKYYVMGANTIFGHLIPFVLIMVLNFSNFRILRSNEKNSLGLIQNSPQHGVRTKLLERSSTMKIIRSQSVQGK